MENVPACNGVIGHWVAGGTRLFIRGADTTLHLWPWISYGQLFTDSGQRKALPVGQVGLKIERGFRSDIVFDIHLLVFLFYIHIYSYLQYFYMRSTCRVVYYYIDGYKKIGIFPAPNPIGTGYELVISNLSASDPQ